MSIQFFCDRCGHEIDLDERFAGKHGVCKHCGHALVVPEHAHAATDSPLLLRPLEEEPAGPHKHLLDPHAPLVIRPATAEPHAKPAAISGPDDPAATSQGDYTTRATGNERHSSAGPPPLWLNAPSLLARTISHWLLALRNWAYLISLAALVLALIGFLFKIKAALHVGVVVAIAANIGMLVVGIAYLVTLPFKEGMRYGLANVLVPFYAVYYWYTRWPKMKTPVRKTAGAFLPILLAGVAFVTYEDGKQIVDAVEREVPVVEEEIEKGVKKLEVGPIKEVEKRVEGAVDAEPDNTKGQPR